jgi:hypothetical protein
MAGLVSGIASGQRDALVDAIAGELRTSVQRDAAEGELTFPQEAHVVLARK